MSTFDEIWRMADDLRDVVPILTLTEEERREIVSHMRVRRFDTDEAIYHEGDAGQELFVMHSGRVLSWLEDDQGHRALLSTFGRGQFFGELELFASVPGRLTTVTAARPTTALQITHEDAVGVLRRNAEALYFMARRFLELYRRLRDTTAGLVFMDAQGRVADVLLELDRIGVQDEIPLTQEDFAAAAGVSGRTFRRIAADLARRGLVEISVRRVRVLDQARLRAEVRASHPVGNSAGIERRLGDVVLGDA